MGRKRHQKRVTVGRRFGDYVRAYYATRAGPVVDDDLLAERRFELSATTRAKVSVLPPAPVGTTRRTGRLG